MKIVGIHQPTIKKRNVHYQSTPQKGFFEYCGLALGNAKLSLRSKAFKRIRACRWAAAKVCTLLHESAAFLERRVFAEIREVADDLRGANLSEENEGDIVIESDDSDDELSPSWQSGGDEHDIIILSDDEDLPGEPRRAVRGQRRYENGRLRRRIYSTVKRSVRALQAASYKVQNFQGFHGWLPSWTSYKPEEVKEELEPVLTKRKPALYRRYPAKEKKKQAAEQLPKVLSRGHSQASSIEKQELPDTLKVSAKPASTQKNQLPKPQCEPLYQSLAQAKLLLDNVFLPHRQPQRGRILRKIRAAPPPPRPAIKKRSSPETSDDTDLNAWAVDHERHWTLRQGSMERLRQRFSAAAGCVSTSTSLFSVGSTPVRPGRRARCNMRHRVFAVSSSPYKAPRTLVRLLVGQEVPVEWRNKALRELKAAPCLPLLATKKRSKPEKYEDSSLIDWAIELENPQKDRRVHTYRLPFADATAWNEATMTQLLVRFLVASGFARFGAASSAQVFSIGSTPPRIARRASPKVRARARSIKRIH